MATSSFTSARVPPAEDTMSDVGRKPEMMSYASYAPAFNGVLDIKDRTRAARLPR